MLSHVVLAVGFLFSMVPVVSFSQADTLRERTELADLYVAGGSYRFPVFSMSQENFKEIVPRSQILSGDIMKINFNDFGNDSAGGYFSTSGRTANYAQAGITLRLKNKEFHKAGPWLKVGLSYFSASTILNTGVFKLRQKSETDVYFLGVNSVTRVSADKQTVNYVYSCESINMESTLIYKLNPGGIFSLFGGPGAFLGLNFNGRAKVTSTRETTVSDYLALPGEGNILYKTTKQTTVQKEEFDIHPNVSLGLFINIGVDLRLGTNYDYIKNTHLFAEVKPLFRAYGVKAAGLQSSVILVANVGLKYVLE